jgi:hypothetical protein
MIILFVYIKNHYGEVRYIKSNIDNRTYLVKKLPDSQQAADRLAKINKKIQTFIKHMMSSYPDNNDVKRLYENYSPENLSEGTADHGYTSYSINKGERIVLCIRQKDTNEFVDENVVMYPTIHELAHIAITEIGHTPIFWEKFKWFLEEAIKIGVYVKVDYAKNNVPYCGIKLTTSVI